MKLKFPVRALDHLGPYQKLGSVAMLVQIDASLEDARAILCELLTKVGEHDMRAMLVDLWPDLMDDK